MVPDGSVVRLNSSIIPRRWQREAFDLWAKPMRGIAQVVTGGGKTIFAELCIQEFLQRFPEGSCVIVVPTVTLLDQWYVDLTADFVLDASEVACFGGGNHPTRGSKLNICVINTARDIAPRLGASRPTFLIVDECHRAGSPENAHALSGKHAATLGLSATPEREYDEGFSELISPALGEIFYRYDYAEAHKDRVITDFRLINVKIELLPEESVEYEKLTKAIARAANSRSRDDERLHALLRKRAGISATAALRVPWAIKLAERHRGERTIIFHERISAIGEIVSALRAESISAVAYHSKLSPSLRRDNLLMFKKGIVDVLGTCRALDEGANIPEASVAVVASSTASTRQRIQRLGRVLRPARGKDAATIYTLYATDLEGDRLRREEGELSGVAEIAWKSGAVSR